MNVLCEKKDKQNELAKIVKDNKLVMSKYYLEQSEQKLLYKIIEHIQKNDFKVKEITITYSEFLKEFRAVLGKNITRKEFISLISKLQTKIPQILINDNEYMQVPWYNVIGDLKGTYVKLEIPDRIFNYIYSLSRNFTMLNLKSLYSFKKFYSMRLYELTKQWSRDNEDIEIVYDINYLKALLGLEDKKSYNNFSNFKIKALQPAVDEINSISEVKIKYDTITEGKKVTSIKFSIFDKGNKNKKDISNSQKQSKNYNEPKSLRFKNFDEREYDYGATCCYTSTKVRKVA